MIPTWTKDRLQSWAFALRDLPAPQKTLMLTFAMLCQIKAGYRVCASIPKVQSITGLCETTIRKHRTALIERGFLEPLEEKALRDCPVYRLICPATADHLKFHGDRKLSPAFNPTLSFDKQRARYAEQQQQAREQVITQAEAANDAGEELEQLCLDYLEYEASSPEDLTPSHIPDFISGTESKDIKEPPLIPQRGRKPTKRIAEFQLENLTTQQQVDLLITSYGEQRFWQATEVLEHHIWHTHPGGYTETSCKALLPILRVLTGSLQPSVDELKLLTDNALIADDDYRLEPRRLFTDRAFRRLLTPPDFIEAALNDTTDLRW